MQRSQKQKRAGLVRGDELSREFACEVKAGIDIDRSHLLPGIVTDGQGVIGLAPWRRRTVNEVGDLSDRGLCVRQ